MVANGWRRGGLGPADANDARRMKGQGPTVQCRELFQCPGINHNGKYLKRMYINIKLSHFAIQQKLTHHKSKKIKKKMSLLY